MPPTGSFQPGAAESVPARVALVALVDVRNRGVAKLRADPLSAALVTMPKEMGHCPLRYSSSLGGKLRARAFLASLLVLTLAAGAQGLAAAGGAQDRRTTTTRATGGLPRGFVPAAARPSATGRYFVNLEAPSLAERIFSARAAGRSAARSSQQQELAQVRASQQDAIRAAEGSGTVIFRYGRLVNAFSAELSPAAAEALRRNPDVASVEPVSVVRRTNESSVPFIGTEKIYDKLGVKGQGMNVALVDTGIDYTHADFGGPGTVKAYERNDPTYREAGTFPTNKVIGGYDFVGEDYDVLDDSESNDTPRPDSDPLDTDGHGTHTGGTCCGIGVPDKVGHGVAPKAKLLAYRVWDVGNSTDDVLVAAYERAVDPNQDGDVGDRADVLSFSGGVTYGTLNSVEAVAAARVVKLGTVFVASAGNSGNQPAGGSPYVLGTPASVPSVIAVAASIDQFVAQTLDVNQPEGLTLPDKGIIVHQDWSGAITEDITDDVLDAREFDPPDDPNGVPSPEDRQLCDETPPGEPFAGKIALVFKGSTGAGDCDGTAKVFRAQEAGAIAVILWSGFGGAPFGLGPGEFADQVGIPAVMVGTADGEVLGEAASPDAPAQYNTGNLNVTINADTEVIPGFEDRMTDFTSEGPARLTNDLKPDVSAPGADITSAGVGTGDGAATLSGTSMAAPHISGVATLLRQIHPGWSVRRIKAVIMNQAKVKGMKNNDGSGPVPATVMGAGRVQADESAFAQSLALPGSLSFGLQEVNDRKRVTQAFTVKNTGARTHSYALDSSVRYTDFDADPARVKLSLNGSNFSRSESFSLRPGSQRKVWARLTVDPAEISTAEQEFGWYFFNANADGIINITQSGGQTDRLHVSWHVVPRAASGNGTRREHLDLSSGPRLLRIKHKGSGVSHADAYLLGAEDEVDSYGEEDITHIGARSFTGDSIDGDASGEPRGTDALAGLTWIDFLASGDRPDEPVEFGVRTSGLHNTTETLEVDVLIDSGADGIFADDDLQADYMAVKLPGGGETCLFDLSLEDPFAECAATYFPDYSNFNTNVTGVVVDAQDIGLNNGRSELAYSVTACTGTFSGDVPQQICDSAGSFDEEQGTYGPQLDTTNPALELRPKVCGGFWGNPNCEAIEVSTGSAEPGDDPSILMLFPNNVRLRTAKLITTTTGPSE
jgi:minor extracellular serine protease Vpr